MDVGAGEQEWALVVQKSGDAPFSTSLSMEARGKRQRAEEKKCLARNHDLAQGSTLQCEVTRIATIHPGGAVGLGSGGEGPARALQFMSDVYQVEQQ